MLLGESNSHISNKNTNPPEAQYKDVYWNTCIERNVKEIGEKSKGYKIMHIKESRTMSYLYSNLMFAGIILGPMSGLLTGIGSTLNPNAPITFPIISACVAFISGIIVAITKYGKFEERCSHHKISASKYTGLESNVRRQLVLRRQDRINAIQYLEYIGGNFDELFLSSPLVSKVVYENYVTMAKKIGIFIPDEYGLTIQIDEMFQTRKLNDIRNVSSIEINEESESCENIENNNTHEDIKTKTPESKTPESKTPESKTRLAENELKGEKEIKRLGTFRHFPEFNKYSDGRMEYEMQRMMGLR
jgi:hypothetical protein